MPDVISFIYPDLLAGCLSVLLGKDINTGHYMQTSTKFCISAMLIGTNHFCPFVCTTFLNVNIG